MADNTQESTRPIAKLPTRLIVNTDTGAADLYVDEGVFGRTLVATGSARGNSWTINSSFVKKYNTRNGTNLNQSQIQKIFNTQYRDTANKDRAAIINKYSPYNTKTFLSKTAKLPGVTDPQTGTKPGDTTTVPTKAPKPDGGDGSRPAPEPSKDKPDASEPTQGAEAAAGSSISRDKFPTNLKYPIDLADTNQDVLKINMVKYVPRKPGGGAIEELAFGFSPGRAKPDQIIGSVFLPIPSGISDTNSVQYGSDNMNPIQAELAAIALTTITGGGEAGMDQAGNLINKIKAGSSPVKTGIAAFFAASAAGTAGNSLLSRTTGAILNPNMELLFQQPTLRPFSFTFKLSARSAAEAKQIIKIIRFFKQGMAVQRTPSNLFLKTPHTFQLEYLNNGQPHKYLNKFKECALQSFTVDYAPEGNYATFIDGVMVSYQITMQFQELEPVFNDDYTPLDNNADNQIGY
jgi:hypothetical protein